MKQTKNTRASWLLVYYFILLILNIVHPIIFMCVTIENATKRMYLFKQLSSIIYIYAMFHIFSAKVRSFVICKECGKRRCVYCKQRLNVTQVRALDRCSEELDYVCGSPLFPTENAFHAELFVRENLECQAPIETSYYGGTI